MTSQINRFFIVLTVLYVLGFSLAIYIPNEVTTKPPKRREPVLPWYPVGTDKDYIDSTEDLASQRSPKWHVNPDDVKSRKPIIVNAETKTWSPWRRNPDSEIEQRTEVSDDRKINFDQNRDRSLDNKQLQQQENQDVSLSFDDQVTDRIYLNDKTKENKTSINPDENKRKAEEKDYRDFYEDVPNDSTKSQKEEIYLPAKPKSTVARYDSRLGVQCPTSDATGQFTYPPDCKFFVNCWKGRAFVQPCAPGTLFNPDTLECDFPHKVKCYGGEIVEFPSTDDLSTTGRREPLITGSHSHLYPEKIQEVKCPPHLTGLIAHPTNCTKFLQCANGGTFIKDCGPGTVFNPAISVCDWPRNVKGCEDALRSKEDRNPLVPPFHPESFDHKRLKYNEPVTKKIACPPDYTGLLPHPETCKKFLQCANGGTFIMDCGPGTAFNPLISVCDWPYNVPGCSETTTVKPWSAWSHQSSKPSQTYHPHNQTTTEHKPIWWSSGHNYHTTTSLPKTNWDDLRPTWRPTWKSDSVMSTTPTYDRHDYYNRHKTTGNFNHHPTAGYDHSSGQWSHHHRADNDDNRHGGGQDFNYEHHQHAHQHGHQYGHHHGHHYGHANGQHHGHQHGQHHSKPYDQNIGQSPPPYDSPHSQPHGYVPPQGRKYDQESPGPGWYPDYRPGNRDKPWNYPIPDYPEESDEFDEQVPQTPYQTDDKGRSSDEAFDGNRGATVQHETGIQSSRRTGHEFTQNRQEYGRTNPWFSHPEFPEKPAPEGGNSYVKHDNHVPPEGKINTTRIISPWNGQTNKTVIWSSRDRMNWSQSEIPGGPGFRPSNWDGQQEQIPSQSQTTQWEQGTLSGDDRLREWETRPNIHQQSTIDKEAGSKVNQWTSNTNVFQHAKGHAQIGNEDSTKIPIRPSYPTSIYVNVNGTKGHFITKDIENNSKTKSYSPNDLQESSKKKNENNYTGADTRYPIEQPPTDLQPLYYSPVNHSFATDDMIAASNYPKLFTSHHQLNHQNFIHHQSDTQFGAPGGTDKHRTLTPSTNRQPPFYEPPSRSWISPSSYQPSNVGRHYPPVPATDLQPPFLDSSNSNSPSVTNQQTINSQRPQMPANDLLPPYHQSPSMTSSHATTPTDVNTWYPATPVGDLQPPFDDSPNRRLDYPDSTKSPVFDNQYPAIPASGLQPPFDDSPNRRLDYPDSTKSPVFDNQYPAVPASDLQPPFYDFSNHRLDYPDYPKPPILDSQRPIVPANDLLPPLYESPNGRSDSPYSTKSPIFDSQHPVVPASGLLPPLYESPNGRSDSPYATKSPIFDSQHPVVPASGLLPPLYESPNGRSDSPYATKSPIFDSQHPVVPASGLLPPLYESPNGRSDSPYATKSPIFDSQHPVVPASDLLPPLYESPNGRSDSPYTTKSPIFDSQHPVVPASGLLPPLYESPNGRSDSIYTTKSPIFDSQQPVVPASDLLPPLYESPNRSERTLNSTVTSDVKPPFYQTANYSTDYPRSTDGSYNNRPVVHTQTTTQRAPDIHLTVPARKKVQSTTQRAYTLSTTTDRNVNNVTNEYMDQSTKKFLDVVEPDIDYEVDVLDDKEEWKPVLVFENKTKTTTESSVIMKINKKKVDVDLFNIEAAPYADDEPPFPVYYVPSVQPLSHSKKSALPTPISGQAVRLRGGTGPHDGYVEVQGINPGWGVVCDSKNSWTLKEAHVVCRQLGYSRGAEMAWQGRNNRNTVPTWIAANSVTCTGNETRFQSCKFTHDQECRVERDAIGVRCTPNRVALCRKDEMPFEGQCYHLADPDNGLNHAEASAYCAQRQARLIDITNQQENDFVSEWLVQLHPEVGSIMTSGLGFTTLNRTIWLWEDSSRAKFRFTKWWPGWMEDKKHPPFVGARPLCVLMKRKFPCHERSESICVADYFFWDAEDCASSAKGHSYICKRPYDDIGCVYGKGGQYAGTANVTASGKDCLPWADPKVSHRLTVTVVNRDVREKLKTHNYCRNPNPSRETRPWCFAGPSGERENCDIPPCGNAETRSAASTSQCKPTDFQCLPGVCISSRWVCDGKEDCSNGADEKACKKHLDLFQKRAGHKLEGYDVEKWLNTPLKMCALRCKEADFTCRSFAHKAIGNICLLSDSNIGMTGSLVADKEFDYYEMKERSMNCDGMYVCGNRKCINQTKVCNGKNDCNDRTDESICTVENLDYAIRLAGSNNSHEGRIEVKILGVWGQVCDDGFGMIAADVICKELGFELGVLEIRPGGFYGNLNPPTRFMVDQLKCQGNETSLRECDFEGWGVHNCQPEEAVGVVCKTAVDSCQEGHWKCDNSRTCIPAAFICDEVVDCPDGSDESPAHCDAPFEIRLVNGSSRLQGRVEVRHHGIWGTICDDDFSNATAAVICRSLGYGGVAIAKKNGFFGAGEGLIWLDEVFCHGNETQLYRCEHNHWGQHNCDHNEDAGVICTPGDVNDSKLQWETVPDLPETDINDLLPANCGKRFKDFNDDEDLIFAKVVHGSVAPKGTYPWQASIRVRGHSRSSHWCGAVVLSPLHVLTAAHCLEGYNKGTYFVRAGDYNTEIDEGTEIEANIEDYYIHEDFRKGHRMNNDIALVLLKGRGIPLGKDIVPICLPSENTEYPAGLNCTISGFGSIETGKSTHSKDLRYGWVPLLDQSVCRAGHVYGEGAISSGMVCAGYLDEGVDTCDGDSGGPLACYQNGAFTLYGITSWGQHCGRANKPGVYVRVSHYRRWIDRKIRDSLLGR